MSRPRSNSARRQRGYMLLILMFFVALLTFSMMATLPRVIQQVKRDREEEMIHRGTEYARAVKKYYKKFNKYPNSLQDLEDTNQIRFIRRRYKDPMSKDGAWKLMHLTDVQQGISNPNFGLSQANNFNPTQGGPGGSPFGPGISGNGPGFGGPQSYSGPGGQQGLGSQAPTPGASPDQSGNQPPTAPGATGPTGTTTTTDTGSSPSNFGSSPSAGTPGNPATGGQTGQTYGAGGIVGVQSLSKAKTIREFADKHNYNKWMFIYDPTQDKGTLLKGPYNPQAFQGGGGAATQPGQNGQPGQILLPGANGAPGTGGLQNQGGPGSPGQQMPPDQNAPPQ